MALPGQTNASRAARFVNMSPEGAYYLRRQRGSESFRRAWEAALDFGVQRLKDVAYERAIDGQLSPVFVAGKLKGFRRIRNDRLLMFCLRMNARDERGQRLSASYFDPGAERLHGGAESANAAAPGHSYTIPARTRAEKDDMNAALIEHFDPVSMTLPEIEAMQEMLAEAAKRARAEEDGPPDHNPDPDFVELRSSDWKAAGELEDMVEVEDELEQFAPDEDHWRDLDEEVPD